MKFRVNRINGMRIQQFRPLLGAFKYFDYEVDEIIEGEVINWKADKFTFKVKEAALVEDVGLKT